MDRHKYCYIVSKKNYFQHNEQCKTHQELGNIHTVSWLCLYSMIFLLHKSLYKKSNQLLQAGALIIIIKSFI